MKDFSWPIYSFNEMEYKAFQTEFECNQNNMIGKKVFIFGAGIRGCMFLKFCELLGIEIQGFIDNDKNKQGGYINSYLIHSFNEVLEQEEKVYIIVSTEVSEHIVDQMKGALLKEKQDFYCVRPCFYDDFTETYFADKEVTNLFMGDCIFSQVAIDDIDFRSLENMIYDAFGVEKTKVLGMHGMPIRTFYQLLKLYIKIEKKPQKVILAVNTVMFSGKKNQLPRAQHTPLLQKIQDRLTFSDIEFDMYVEITRKRMNQFQTDAFITSEKQLRNRNSKHISDMRMRLNYMYDLDLEEEGVTYLIQFAKLCIENNISFVPFLPPINYEYGTSVFGDQFISYCNQNSDKLKCLLKDIGIELADASYLLDRNCFASGDTINEVSNYQGRKKEIAFLDQLLAKY